MEFALAIPEDLFTWRDNHQHYLFRRAVSDILSENIVWEPKIGDSEHIEQSRKLWYESLILWMQNNEKELKNKNCYMDRSKIIDRFRIHLENKENNIEDDIVATGILASILLLNLTTNETDLMLNQL